MAHTVVKITVNDDGDKYQDPKWHLYDRFGDSDRTFCSGEVFGFGESIAEFKTKIVEKGGITCHLCLKRIKSIKSIKL